MVKGTLHLNLFCLSSPWKLRLFMGSWFQAISPDLSQLKWTYHTYFWERVNTSISAINSNAFVTRFSEDIVENVSVEVFRLLIALSSFIHKRFLRELGALRQIKVANELKALIMLIFISAWKALLSAWSVGNVWTRLSQVRVEAAPAQMSEGIRWMQWNVCESVRVNRESCTTGGWRRKGRSGGGLWRLQLQRKEWAGNLKGAGEGRTLEGKSEGMEVTPTGRSLGVCTVNTRPCGDYYWTFPSLLCCVGILYLRISTVLSMSIL